jgi:hypothetical protein
MHCAAAGILRCQSAAQTRSPNTTQQVSYGGCSECSSSITVLVIVVGGHDNQITGLGSSATPSHACRMTAAFEQHVGTSQNLKKVKKSLNRKDSGCTCRRNKRSSARVTENQASGAQDSGICTREQKRQCVTRKTRALLMCSLHICQDSRAREPESKRLRHEKAP